MSTLQSTPAMAQEPSLPHRLTPTILVSIYLTVPLLVCIMLVDYLLVGNDASNRLALSPHTIMFVGLFLQTPHAFASLLSFLDKEYIAEYRFKLVKCLALGLASLSFPLIFGPALFTLFLASYTFYHQSSQQAGIAAMLARNKSTAHLVWRWCSFVIFFIGMLGLFIKGNPAVTFFSVPVVKLVLMVLGALFFSFYALVGLKVMRQSRTREGRWYILANTAMFLAFMLFFVTDHFFYMILMPVIVHDLTAFAFYINHNANRNATARPNVVSRIRNVVAMPEYLLTPLAGLAFGVACYFGLDNMTYAYVAMVINVMHFYAEGIMWKAGTPHRRHVQV